MNQPSCSLSLDLDTCSNSSDSLSECETLTVPDPNDPVTVQKFVEETVVGPISLQKQNVDRISAINSQLHIGDVHKNFFHFHGNIKPPTKEETQENGGNEPNSHHSSGVKKSAQNLHQYHLRLVLVPSIIVVLLLALTTTLAIFKVSLSGQTFVFRPVDPNTTVYIENHPVYFRNNWGGLKEAKSVPLNAKPTSLVIISHTATELCDTFLKCSNITQRVQFENLQSEQPDIEYNFLIGGDGGIYTGRGWDKQNSIRVGSVAIAFIGYFNKDVPDSKAVDAGKVLITEGVKLGKIAPVYKLIGENQTSAQRFYSPGRNLVAVIKNWDNYFSGSWL